MALPWGNARTQFQLVRAQVISEIGKGVPRRKIFEALRKEGKISMSRSIFYEHAAKALNPKPETTCGSAIDPTAQEGGSGLETPQSPLLPAKSAGKSRFQMADEIPDYSE